MSFIGSLNIPTNYVREVALIINQMGEIYDDAGNKITIAQKFELIKNSTGYNNELISNIESNIGLSFKQQIDAILDSDGNIITAEQLEVQPTLLFKDVKDNTDSITSIRDDIGVPFKASIDEVLHHYDGSIIVAGENQILATKIFKNIDDLNLLIYTNFYRIL